MNDRPILTTRLLFGLVLMALGVLWTLDQMGLLDASRLLAWWPAVAIAWGFLLVVGRGVRARPRPTAGGIWMAVGVLGALQNLHVWRFSVADIFPLLLLFVGGLLIVRAWRGTRFERAAATGPAPPAPSGGAFAAAPGGAPAADARVNLFMILAGAERRVTSQAFEGGELSAILGGLAVDLRGAQLAQRHAVLDVFAMWGGIEVLAPPGWRVVSRVTPVLGAVVDSMPEPSAPDAPVLELRGLAVMGGVDVHSDDRPGRRIRRAVIGAHLAPGVQVGVIEARRRRDRGAAPDETAGD